MENIKEIITYRVVITKGVRTGCIAAMFKSRKAATKKADALDLAYGCISHKVVRHSM